MFPHFPFLVPPLPRAPRAATLHFIQTPPPPTPKIIHSIRPRMHATRPLSRNAPLYITGPLLPPAPELWKSSASLHSAARPPGAPSADVCGPGQELLGHCISLPCSAGSLRGLACGCGRRAVEKEWCGFVLFCCSMARGVPAGGAGSVQGVRMRCGLPPPPPAPFHDDSQTLLSVESIQPATRMSDFTDASLSPRGHSAGARRRRLRRQQPQPCRSWGQLRRSRPRALMVPGNGMRARIHFRL